MRDVIDALKLCEEFMANRRDELSVCEFRRTTSVCVCVEKTGEGCELIAFASAAKIHQRSDTEIVWTPVCCPLAVHTAAAVTTSSFETRNIK